MEIKSVNDMAKFLAKIIDNVDEDEIWIYANKIDASVPIVNTFTVQDRNTGKSYLVNVKETK